MSVLFEGLVKLIVIIIVLAVAVYFVKKTVLEVKALSSSYREYKLKRMNGGGDHE